MKVVCISGTRDSGKTSIIKALITQLVSQGKTSAVILNDQGEQAFDQNFIEATKTAVEKLSGG